MAGIDRPRVIGAQSELIGRGGGLGEVSTGENELDPRVLRQRLADAVAEESIGT